VGPLAAILLFAGATDAFLFWRGTNALPSGHDAGTHFTFAMSFALAAEQGPAAAWRAIAALPFHYQPLTYVVLAYFGRWGADAFAAADATTVFFWCFVAAALLATGRHLERRRGLWLLPLAGALAIPTTWTILTEFNLEISLLAAACVIFGMMICADRIKTPFGLAAASALTAVFAWTKVVLFLPLVPAGLLLVWRGEPQLRFRRGVILAAYLFAVGGWFAMHYHQFGKELAIDLYPGLGEKFPGLTYYLWVQLVDFRGLPLVAALIALLWRSRRDRTWEDLAYFLFWFVPFVFYQIVETKRAWYMLAAFSALPVWYLHLAHRLWDAKWVRALSVALLGGYLALAAANIAIVRESAVIRRPDLLQFAGINKPERLTPTEIALARRILARLARSPDADYFVLTVDRQLAERTHMLLLGMDRCYASGPRLNPEGGLPELVRSLAYAEFLFAVGSPWPRFDDLPYPSGYREAYRKAFERTSAVVRQRLTAEDIATLPDGRKLYQYAATEAPRRTLRHPVPGCGVADQRTLKRDLFSALVKREKNVGDWPAALAVLAALRRHSLSNEIPGVNLEEAMIRRQLGQTEYAEELLRRNLNPVVVKDGVFADSALLLARLRVERGDFAAAEQYLDLALSAAFDANTAASTAATVAARMEAAGRRDAALVLLNRVLAHLSGSSAGLVRMEIGKLCLHSGDVPGAQQAFQQALAEVTDEGQKQWIRQTLEAIRRGEWRSE